ncbi:MAG: hypothetical protein ACFE8L_05500 [Candidatus Hodarchaeota archaeon]
MGWNYPWQARAIGGIIDFVGFIILFVCYLSDFSLSGDLLIVGIILSVIGLLIGAPEVLYGIILVICAILDG